MEIRLWLGKHCPTSSQHARVLAARETLALPSDLVVSSGTTVSLLAPPETDPQRLQEHLGEEVEVRVVTQRALLGVIGSGLSAAEGLRAEVLRELACWDPDLIVQGASGTSVLAVLRRDALRTAVERLHARFFEGSAKH